MAEMDGIVICRSHRWRGWLMVFIAFMQHFLTLGIAFNYSIIFLSFQKEFRKSAALTGWVGSLANALLCCVSPVCILLTQRIGLRWTNLLGSVLYCGGLIATSFVPHLAYTFVTFGLLVGVGINFVIHSGCSVLLEWFPGKNCSRATSISLIGSSVGMLFMAPLMNVLTEIYNWRNMLRIIAACNLVISLFHGAFLARPKRTHISAKELKDADPSESIHMKDGEEEDTKNEDTVDDCHQQASSRPRSIKVLLLLDTWMWLLCLTFGNLGWSFITISYASYMEHDFNCSRDQISIAIILFSVGEFVGKVAVSIGGDHLPFLKLYVVAVSSILGGLASGLMTLLHTLPVMFAVSFFLGLCRAGSYGMPLSAAMQIFGHYGPDVVSALVLMPWGLGIFIGAPLSGGLYDLTGDYTLSLIVITGIFICSAVAVLVIPLKQRMYRRKAANPAPDAYTTISAL